MNEHKTAINKRTLHIRPLPDEFGITLKKAAADHTASGGASRPAGGENTGSSTSGASDGRNTGSSSSGTSAGMISGSSSSGASDGRNTGYAAGDSSHDPHQGTPPVSTVKSKPAKKKMTFGRFILMLFVCGIAYWAGKSIAPYMGFGSSRTINTVSESFSSAAETNTDSDETESTIAAGSGFGNISDDRVTATAETVQEYFASMGSVDLSQIGSQTAEAGSDLYITNLEQGKIVGSQQEITVIPWNDAWKSDDDEPRIRHNVSGIDVTFTINNKYASCSYSYDLEAAAPMYERYKQISGRELSELQQKEIAGTVYQTFHQQTNDLVYAYAMRDLDTEGKFCCYVNTGSDTDIDIDELLENALSGLQTVNNSFESITAASPVAARMLAEDNGACRVIVQSDILRHAGLWKQAESVQGYGNYGNGLYWNAGETRGLLSYSHYYAYTTGVDTCESVSYDFSRGGEADFKEESVKTGYSDEYVSKLKKGKLQKGDVNGYPVYARFLQFQYTRPDTPVVIELISIGVQLTDDCYLFIQEKVEDPPESYEDQLESVVARLAGDYLQVVS